MAENLGRPKADINWDMVDEYLIAGCSGREIAGLIGLNPATIYDRCEKDHGIPFSDYSQQRYSKGESLIRQKQFLKALKGDGDNTMLIWLGKTRLGQKEPTNGIEVDVNTATLFEQLMKALAQLQLDSGESLKEIQGDASANALTMSSSE